MESVLADLSSSDAFEALCYDILLAEGFVDVRWRGPGPDGGRDIEARWGTTDPTGAQYATRWYIECKWYSDSVPFSEIEPKLLAASAAGVDYMLVMTSSRIRNTAIESIDEWLRARGRPFRVRYWIGHDVLSLAVRHAGVFSRHFPTREAPSWGTAEQRIRQLKAVAASSTDRLTWRLAPSLQWIANTRRSSGSKGKSVDDELDLLECMLCAHQLFSLTAPERAATRTLDVRGCVEFVCAAVDRRRPGKLLHALSIDVRATVSRPMLVSALFEITLNAALYGDGPGRVELQSTGPHWSVIVKNESDASLLSTWPQLGWRGPDAVVRNTAGQGLGCWLARTAAETTGLQLSWSKVDAQWVVALSGASES